MSEEDKELQSMATKVEEGVRQDMVGASSHRIDVLYKYICLGEQSINDLDAQK